MDKDNSMFQDLQEKCKFVHEKFQSIKDMEVIGDTCSPVKHLVLKQYIKEALHTKDVYQDIADSVSNNKMVSYVIYYCSYI